jgi:hypothetical protein
MSGQLEPWPVLEAHPSYPGRTPAIVEDFELDMVELDGARYVLFGQDIPQVAKTKIEWRQRWVVCTLWAPPLLSLGDREIYPARLYCRAASRPLGWESVLTN